MSVHNETVAPKSQGWRGQLVQLAGIVLVVFLAKGALAEPFYVPSGSMEPTLDIGDALLATKFAYGYSTASLPIQINLPETGRLFPERPKLGDVVVFRWPGDRSQAWVKRVVGLPGDRIQMRQGQLFINDRAAELKPDGVGRAEDDNGGAERAYRYIETLPNGVSHEIFKLRDNGRLDNTAEVTVPPGQTAATFFYQDTTSGTATLTAATPTAAAQTASGQFSMSVAAGDTVKLSVFGVANPAAAVPSGEFSVSTSADAKPVAVPFAITGVWPRIP